MIAGKRRIQNGKQYDNLFPKSQGKNLLIKRDASLNDSVNLIKRVIASTLGDTKPFSKIVLGRSIRDTAANLDSFVRNHFQYEKDKEGVEQIRRPSRSWTDRFVGVDCDCGSVFKSSTLVNLGIPHALKITRYGTSKNYSHIYVIVWAENGTRICPKTKKKYFTIDFVNDNGFDAEVTPSDFILHDMTYLIKNKTNLSGLPEERSFGVSYLLGTLAVVSLTLGAYWYINKENL